MTAFVDTNIMIAVLDDSDKFHGWAVERFEEALASGPVIITDIVYCEFSIGMGGKDAVDAAVAQLGVERFGRNDHSLVRAGVAFMQYKQQGGPKVNVLPDFLIGAAAATVGAPLITTNPKDFQNYFPEIALISPPT